MELSNEIDEAASAWLIRRDCGQWSEAERARFEAWLAASPLHRVTYLRLELAWEEAARLKALGAGIRDDRPPPPGQWNLTPFFDSGEPEPESIPTPDSEALRSEAGGRNDVPPRSTLPRLWAAGLAAAVVLGMSVGAYLTLGQGGDRFTTPVGGIASVPMIDGSQVTLNTDSQIRVALTDMERRVELKQGEAFFNVAKDPKRPFIVRAGNKSVVAVGTQFSVRRDGDDLEVVVTEGKVRVDDAGETLLTAGSVARAADAGVLVQRKSLPEAEEQLSWRTGVLMFRDQSLSSAVAEFNRYNKRKIVIDDPTVGALKIEGNFRATNVDAFVRLLENAFPVSATEQGGGRILLTPK